MIELQDSIILQGDSLDVMKQLPSKSVHLVFTSPPYAGFFREYSEKGDARDLGQLDTKEFVDRFMPYVHEIERILRHEEGGVFILNIGEKYLDGFASKYPYRLMLKICDETKFDLIDEIPFIKCDPMVNKNSRAGTLGWEHIFVFGSDKKKININWEFMKSPYRTADRNIASRRDYKRIRKQTGDPMNDAQCYDDIGALPRNYIFCAEKISSQEEFDYLQTHYALFATQNYDGSCHKAQMPIALAEYFIGGFSKEGQWVLDPFCGGGTSGMAAHRLGRKYVLIDLIKENCEISEKRIKAIPRQTNLYNFYGLSKDDKPKLEEIKDKTKTKSLF